MRRTSRGPAPRPQQIQRREVGPRDVLIEITYAGICRADIHPVTGGWGQELVSAARSRDRRSGHPGWLEVTRYAVGDPVGVGCFVDSCRECDYCRTADEQYCDEGNVACTYNAVDRDGRSPTGGYSNHVVVTTTTWCRVPDASRLDAAAPLLCAGITLYSPLRHWKVGPGNRGRRRPRRPRPHGGEGR